MKLRESFHPYAATTILFWSMSYVLTGIAMRHFSAFSLAFLRYAVASLSLLVVCAVIRVPLPRRRDLPWFLLAGTVGFFLYMVVFNIGTAYVSAATSSLIIASVPVFTALFARLAFKERLTTRKWVAIGVEFFGILVLTMYGAVFTANAGVLWLLLAALLLSCYNLLQRRLTKTYSALQTTVFSIFAGTILLAMYLPQSVPELRTANFVPVACILFMGVFSSAIAYVCWAKAFEKAEQTSLVTNYMFFTPFVAGLFGFVIAREIPDAATLAGGVFIVLGALLFNRNGARKQQESTAGAPGESID